MLRRTLSLAAASVTAVAAATVLMPSPAQASDWEHDFYTDESSSIGTPFAGGHLNFHENGDIVTLTDNDEDGWRVYVDVLVGDTWKYTLGASGVGDRDTARASQGGSRNLPENTTITFSMYLYNGSNGNVTGAVIKKYYNDY
jgi:hypothetical protein